MAMFDKPRADRIGALTRAAALCFAFAVALPGDARAVDTGPVSMQAEVSAAEITRALFRSGPSERVDFSGKHLAYLDLSTLNFKGANLARSDFYGTDFTAANLSGVNLTNTRLDRAVLIRANLSGADLTGATILRPTVFTDLSNDLADAPQFSGATLKRIKVQADLSGANFRGADLTEADFSPLEARPGQGTLVTLAKNVLKSCDFSGARLRDAKFNRAVLWFARFTGADLRGADFSEADLTNVDFSGADLRGARFTGADLDGATLSGAIGLDAVVGLATAKNIERARR